MRNESVPKLFLNKFSIICLYKLFIRLSASPSTLCAPLFL